MKCLQRVALFLSLLLLTFSNFVFSQTSSTSLRGTITDPSGQGIPSAAVTLKNMESGMERSVATDTEGRYQFQQLPAGSYILTVIEQGFSRYERKDLVLLVNTPWNPDGDEADPKRLLKKIWGLELE